MKIETEIATHRQNTSNLNWVPHAKRKKEWMKSFRGIAAIISQPLSSIPFRYISQKNHLSEDTNKGDGR